MNNKIEKDPINVDIKKFIQWIVFPVIFALIYGILFKSLFNPVERNIFIVSSIIISWVISWIVNRSGNFSLLKSLILNTFIPILNLIFWFAVLFYKFASSGFAP